MDGRSTLRAELALRVRAAVAEVRALVAELGDADLVIEISLCDGSRVEMTQYLDEIETVLDRAEVVS